MLKGLNDLSNQIHKNNCEKGFYDQPREIGTLLMLCVSELSEALEADRKNRYCHLDDDLYDPKNTSPNYCKAHFQSVVKDTFEDEIADTFIRLFDLAGHLGINIEWHIEQKVKYNKMREKKHGKLY